MEKQIEQTITDFIKGGDNSDTELLDKVLHEEFRTANNNYLDSRGISMVNKETYLQNIKDKVFGGTPREMIIEQIDKTGTIAFAKLQLKSTTKHFFTYVSLLYDENKNWQIIFYLTDIKPL